jgi:hypothetical protein
VLELAGKFIPAADEVFRLQGGTDPECRLFQKFAEKGHYGGSPGTTRQGTYVTTASGAFLGSVNSNDPKRIADLLRNGLARWQALSREERMFPGDPKEQLPAIRRAEKYYPEDGLVLYATTRDLPRPTSKDAAATLRSLGGLGGRVEEAWNQDFAWFSKAEARQFLAAKPQVGQKHEVPNAVFNRIVCAHLVDNVRGQTTPFEDGHVKKAKLTAEVTAVDGDVVTLRLEGESRTEAEGQRPHGLDMRLLGKATFNMTKERFTAFEMVAAGSRWGGTQNNARRADVAEAPIGLVFTLAGDGHCDRIAPAFNFNRIYRPIIPIAGR